MNNLGRTAFLFAMRLIYIEPNQEPRLYTSSTVTTSPGAGRRVAQPIASFRTHEGAPSKLRLGGPVPPQSRHGRQADRYRPGSATGYLLMSTEKIGLTCPC